MKDCMIAAALLGLVVSVCVADVASDYGLSAPATTNATGVCRCVDPRMEVLWADYTNRQARIEKMIERRKAIEKKANPVDKVRMNLGRHRKAVR